MALPTGLIVDISSNAAASNINGGGFNPDNTNMLTDLAGTLCNTASPSVTSVSYTFASTDIGHWLFIKSGTNWTAGWYKIADVIAGAAILSAAVGSNNVDQLSNNRIIRNTVIGCATVASPTGGTFTIDYSRSINAIISPTDLGSTAIAPTTLTSAANLFTPVMVGNLLHITNAGTGGFGVVGWYELVSYTSAGSMETDRTTNNGTAMVSGDGQIGGSLSLGATGTSGDDAVFELITSSASAAGRIFIKNGTYTLGETVTVAAGSAGNAVWPCIVEGWNTARGDRPDGVTLARPLLACGAGAFTMQSQWVVWSVRTTTTASSGLITGTNSRVRNCKVMNTSTTAGRSALVLQTTSYATACEAISYRGNGILASSSVTFGCYIHDCNIGISFGTSVVHIINNIISNCVTAAIFTSGANVSQKVIFGNTLYGAENKLGIGISIGTGTTLFSVMNNIFYGFATGISHADTQTVSMSDYNCFFNNTADVSAATQWQKGANDIAINPLFANVSQITGTTATTSNSGNTLIQAGATFLTGQTPVVAGRDFVYISSTSGTAGIYGILSVDSNTQLTLDLAPGASSGNVSFQITVGRNFAVGASAISMPFPGGYTTSYIKYGSTQSIPGILTSGVSPTQGVSGSKIAGIS